MLIDPDKDLTGKLVKILKCNTPDHEDYHKCVCHLVGKIMKLIGKTPYGYNVLDGDKNMFLVHPTQFSIAEKLK